MPSDDPSTGSTTDSQRIRSALVLGGGFAGVEVAIGLRRAGLSVTLVSERPQLFVYPTSIWVVTGEHSIEQDLIELDDLAAQHGFGLRVGRVERIDAKQHLAVVDGLEFSADVLVLAMGAGRKRLPGTEHTVTIWGEPSDTVAVHERLMALIATGQGRIAVGFGGNPTDTSAIRGGPAFEVMFNIVHLLKSHGLRGRFELSFFAPMPNPGARMGARAAAMVKTMLESENVKLHLGRKLEGFDAQGVKLEGGGRVDADLVIFVPAGAGHPVVAHSNLPLSDAGFIEIDHTCAVVGQENVYAVGDIAALEGPDWRAKQGHLAEVMAKVAVGAIDARRRGKVPEGNYADQMSLVCLMDSGNGGAFVHRDAKRARVFALPVIGHLLKKAWGYYYRWTKLRLHRWIPWAARELFTRRQRTRLVTGQ